MTTPTPEELDAALSRMCTSLDVSRLSGVTAQEDARCMHVIADAIAALREQVAEFKIRNNTQLETLIQVTGKLQKQEADNAALQAERDKFRALLVEWDDGMYDGQDFLRRVRLALHGDKGLTDAALLAGKSERCQGIDMRCGEQCSYVVGHVGACVSFSPDDVVPLAGKEKE